MQTHRQYSDPPETLDLFFLLDGHAIHLITEVPQVPTRTKPLKTIALLYLIAICVLCSYFFTIEDVQLTYLILNYLTTF